MSASIQTSPQAASQPIQLSELTEKNQQECASFFAALPSAKVEQLQGKRWHGDLYALFFVEGLPRVMRKAVVSVLHTAVNPWRGKSFGQTEGQNVWINKTPFVSYQILQQVSPVDGQKCLWLDYNVESNPQLLRAIRGEVRQMSEGLFLARMNWKTKDNYFCVAYFTLNCPEDL